MRVSYLESAEGALISWDRAVEELADHGIGIESLEGVEFQKEFPERETEILASDVLIWLGY